MSEEQLAQIKNCGLECQLEAWRQFPPFKGRAIKVGGRGPDMRKLLLELITEVHQDHLAVYTSLREQCDEDDVVQDLTDPPVATAAATVPPAPPPPARSVGTPPDEQTPPATPPVAQTPPAATPQVTMPVSEPNLLRTKHSKRAAPRAHVQPAKRAKPTVSLEPADICAQYFLQAEVPGTRPRKRSAAVAAILGRR